MIRDSNQRDRNIKSGRAIMLVLIMISSTLITLIPSFAKILIIDFIIAASPILAALITLGI